MHTCKCTVVQHSTNNAKVMGSIPNKLTDASPDSSLNQKVHEEYVLALDTVSKRPGFNVEGRPNSLQLKSQTVVFNTFSLPLPLPPNPNKNLLTTGWPFAVLPPSNAFCSLHHCSPAEANGGQQLWGGGYEVTKVTVLVKSSARLQCGASFPPFKGSPDVHGGRPMAPLFLSFQDLRQTRVNKVIPGVS